MQPGVPYIGNEGAESKPLQISNVIPLTKNR